MFQTSCARETRDIVDPMYCLFVKGQMTQYDFFAIIPMFMYLPTFLVFIMFTVPFVYNAVIIQIITRITTHLLIQCYFNVLYLICLISQRYVIFWCHLFYIFCLLNQCLCVKSSGIFLGKLMFDAHQSKEPSMAIVGV